MPYYCTVPQCTSMAGKAKDVSFHQFPKDKRLADIWNEILKRGKPYTKYSKVCSLHFTLADYTTTSVGKHKGHWRSLRKDAIPSQKLPSYSPAPTHRARSSSSNPSSSASTSAAPVLEVEVGQHIAHAIYVQTMLALHNAGDGEGARATSPSVDGDTLSDSERPIPYRFRNLDEPRDSRSKRKGSLTKRQKRIREIESIHDADSDSSPSPIEDNRASSNSYRCNECSKCFKDPDVYLLHKRTHKNNVEANETLQENETEKEKENVNANKEKSEETLKANPILANLLKTNTNNIQGAAMKNVAPKCNTNGDRYANGSENDNSGVNSDCDESVEDTSENVIVKSEICIEEHDVMEQYSAANAENYIDNEENTNKSMGDIKNDLGNPLEQVFVINTELLDEAARLNSEYVKIMSKSEIKVEINPINVEDDLITVEDLMDS